MSFCRLACRILALLLLFICSAVAAQTSFQPDGYDRVAQNDYLTLFLNKQTTEVAVEHRASGTVWLSNPSTRNTRGQVAIQYFTPMDILRSMDSHADAVAHDQYWLTELQYGIRIDYLLGKEWGQSDFIPIMITQERMEELVLRHLSERDRAFVESQYHLIELSPLPPDYVPLDIPGGVGPEATLFQEHTLTAPGRELTERQRQDLIRLLFSKMLEGRRLPGATPWSQFRPEDFTMFYSTPTYVQVAAPRAWDVDDLFKLVVEVGYTPEHKIDDNTYFGIIPPMRSLEIFTIPLEYILDADSLIVRVPMDELFYSRNEEPGSLMFGARGVPLAVSGQYEGRVGRVAQLFGRVGGERLTYPLHTLTLLPYFGAASAAEEGYIFVPDGSGTLIHLNNPHVGNLTYAQPVYGRDGSLPQDMLTTAEREVQQNHLPVFGMKAGEQAFLAVIEEGDALATIQASTASRALPFNTVGVEFLTQPLDTLTLQPAGDIGGGGAMNVYTDDVYRGNLTIRYSFLHGKEANYVGMAARYRQWLEDQYDMVRRYNQEAIPFYLELVGAIPDTALIMGVPRTVFRPLTTFDEALDIITKLLDGGVENLHVRYVGWMQGGIEHRYPSTVVAERSLGGRAGFLDFVEAVGERGVSLYPDVTFLEVFSGASLGEFRPRTDAARSLTGSIVENLTGYILSPSRLNDLVERFLASYADYPLERVSLRDLGVNIHSDFRDGAGFVERQGSLVMIREQLARMRSAGLELMFEQANSYALPYARHVVHLPLSDSGHNIAGERIPFLQLVAHGLVDYAGEPVNLAKDFFSNRLRIVETGARPYYSWSYADSSTVKGTRFNHLVSLGYDAWLEDAVELYHEMNAVLGPVVGQRIIDHGRLEPDVYQTVFEDGTTIVVNYSRRPVTVRGQTVPAEGYHSFRE